MIRIARTGESGMGPWAQLLLYKDARADMAILDECLGPWNWKRTHKEVAGSVYCTLMVNAEAMIKGRDAIPDDKTVWISREDCGSEGQSGTEADKSKASDSFKRACVNLGIGRELYSTPQIYISLLQGEYFKSGDGKLKAFPKLSVSKITAENGVVTNLEIVDASGTVRYKYGKPASN